jgi:hypothetical protein
MGLIVVEGFIITTSPVAVYGGVQLPPEQMHRIADQVRRQGVPMLAHHDERHRLKPRLLNVDVRETGSGSLGVWVEFEIDEEAWKAAGDIRGFSATMVEPYREADPDSPKPLLQIASDAGHWDDDLRDEVAAALSPHFNASSERLYQFNAEPPAKIIVDFAVPLLPLIGSMGINVFSSALWDGLKLFFRPVRRTEPTIIDFLGALRQRPCSLLRSYG